MACLRDHAVDEVMTVELRLERPRAAPRSWKWVLTFHLKAVDTRRGDIELASFNIFFAPSSRLGLLKNGRERKHASCVGKGRTFVVSEAKLHSRQICACHRGKCPIIYPQLVTLSRDTILIQTLNKSLFYWKMPYEAVCAMRFVRSFV